MALTDLTRISTAGIATGSTIDSPILRKDVDFRGDQVGVGSALFDSSERRLDFKDNVKLRFGDSADLSLWAAGGASYIHEKGSGQLVIQGSNIILESTGGTDYFYGIDGGTTAICHGGSAKVQTTSTGAIVTGVLTATSFSGKITGDTTGNIYAASGISTVYNLRVSNDLTVEGTTTTLDTNLIGVDRIEVGANSNTVVGVAITQSGTADIFNLYDGATEVFSVADGGNITATGSLNLGNTLYWDGDTTTTIDNAGISSTFRFKTGGTTVMDITAGKNVHIKDDRQLLIGASNDLTIYHSSSTNKSYVTSAAHDVIHSFNVGKPWTLQTTAAGKRIHCPTTKSVELYWNANKKFETSGSGTITTGISTVTGVIDAQGYINLAQKIIHTGDPDTSIEFDTNTIKFETQGVQRLRLTSDGKVGINTTTPYSALELQGDGGTNDAQITFTRHGTPGNNGVIGLNFYRIGTDSVAGIGAYRESAMDDAYLAFHTQPTGGNYGERLRITSKGIVSINDSTPETWATLQVNNHTTHNACQVLLRGADQAQIILRDDTGGTDQKCTTIRNDQGTLLIGAHNDAFSSFSHSYRITTAGTHVFGGNTAAPIVDNGELLYRGNTTQTFESLPQSFYLYGDSLGSGSANAGTGMVFGGNYKTDGTITTFAGIHGIKENTTNSEYGGALVFGVRTDGGGDWERMRITSGGNVNIGGNYTQTNAPLQVTTGANDYGYRLTTGSNVVMELLNNDAAGNCEMRGYYNNNTGTRGEGFRLEANGETYFNPGGNTGLNIKSDGTVGINKASPTTTFHVGGTARFDDDVSINSGKKLFTNSSQGQLTIQGGATYPGGAIKFTGGQTGGSFTPRGSLEFFAGEATSLEQVVEFRFDKKVQGIVAPRREFTVSMPAHTTWYYVCTVHSNALCSQVKFCVNGTRDSTVFNATFDVISTHAAPQYHVTSYGCNYTAVYLKMVGNNYGSYNAYIKRSGTTGACDGNVRVYPRMNEYIDQSEDSGYSSTAFEVTAFSGKRIWSSTANNADLDIHGNLSKGSGSFKIPHPLTSLKDTKNLIHSFIEGPSCDLIYRGTVTLSSGSATVNIDTVAGMTAGTFAALNKNVQCFTTNESGWGAVKGSVSGSILTITAQDGSSTDNVSWMVVGQRKDDVIKDSSITDANGDLILEPSIDPTETSPSDTYPSTVVDAP